MTKYKEKVMKRILPILGLAVLLTLLNSISATAGKVRLFKDDTIKVKFDPNMEINSRRLQKDIPLLIYLAEDIEVGGTVIVEAGATGKAVVTELERASTPGKPGYIKVSFVELEAKGEFKTADNEIIKLAGEVDAKGKGQKLLSFILGFGLLIRGTNGEIPTDGIYPATIAETVTLQSD
jgi:hypothetical protein